MLVTQSDSSNVLMEAVRGWLQEKEGYTLDQFDDFYSRYKIDDAFSFILYRLNHSNHLECLDKVVEIREKTEDYKSPIIFLVDDYNCVPTIHNSFFQHQKEYFGIPEYGNIVQAIFNAEAIYFKEKCLDTEPYAINIVPIFEEKFFGERLSYVIKEVCEIVSRWEEVEKLRIHYYNTFIKYYSRIKDPKIKTAKKIYSLNYKYFFKRAETIKKIADGKEGTELNTHNVDLALFRAPIPFSFFDLAQNILFLTNSLPRDGDKIQLLLIDNKTEKCIKHNDSENNPSGSLCDLLKDPKWCGEKISKLMDIRMLGDEVFDHKSHVINFSDKTISNAEFDSASFISKNCKEYKIGVYKKIVESHFVLLDFFLNEKNTYLGFDFIKEISTFGERGRQETIWYFITSAVHDSVTKYSQSGLVAEHYASAVVNSGDDPSTENRKIIFLYKLITFINSRIKNLKAIPEVVITKYFDIDTNEMCKDCFQSDCISESPNEHRNKCFLVTQKKCKDFLAADERFTSLVIPDYPVYRKLFERLDHMLTQLEILPMADWQIIQHQIDFLCKNISELSDKDRRLSCGYLHHAMRERSEIY